MTRLSAFIEGVGLLGPGLNQWPHAAALLTGQAPYAPERTALPLASTRLEIEDNLLVSHQGTTTGVL
ncbi:hypothetical protein ACQCQX_24840, partial [Ralstonia pseudosolanacearum]